MKENIDRILKEQLGNYELPYENGAWEQFSKRLDGTPSTPFYRKWWFAASVGTVLVGSATFFALSSREESTPDSIAPSTETVTDQQVTTTAPTTQLSLEKPTTSTSSTNPSSVLPSGSQVVSPTSYVFDPAVLTTVNPITSTNTNSGNTLQEPGKSTTTIAAFIPLELPTSICLNESFTIQNPNEVAVTVTLPNGRSKTIAAKQSAEIKSPKSGNLVVQSGTTSKTIVVHEAVSHLSIGVDASLLYENGIPTLKFDVTGAENTVTWESNIKAQVATKNELIVHPYTEREVNVVVNSTDQNGCPISEKKSVTLNEVYNLMAPTGFYPLSSDNRTNLFIPIALTLRDTPFEMVILDPNNMTVVFKTTDASMGWNGIDARTGQMVPINSNWLWKVVMKNPLSNEPEEYKGLILRK